MLQLCYLWGAIVGAMGCEPHGQLWGVSHTGNYGSYGSNGMGESAGGKGNYEFWILNWAQAAGLRLRGGGGLFFVVLLFIRNFALKYAEETLHRKLEIVLDRILTSRKENMTDEEIISITEEIRDDKSIGQKILKENASSLSKIYNDMTYQAVINKQQF